MFEGLSPLARDAKSWPFEQARTAAGPHAAPAADRRRARSGRDPDRRRQDRRGGERPARRWRTVLFETGYGPSGLPHIGTFGEVARTTMVRTAFRALTDDAIPTRLIVFSDDMDGLRKVPDNVPNQRDAGRGPRQAADRGARPVRRARELRGAQQRPPARLPRRLRLRLQFLSSTELLPVGPRSTRCCCGRCERFDEIQAVMLPTLGEERRATYSPLPADQPQDRPGAAGPDPGAQPGKGTIVFRDEDGTLTEIPVTGGRVKMQWKPDWAMRWTALRRRLRDVGQGPDRLGQGLRPDLPDPGRRRRRRASTTSCSWTRTTRRSPSPRATA